MPVAVHQRPRPIGEPARHASAGSSAAARRTVSWSRAMSTARRSRCGQPCGGIRAWHGFAVQPGQQSARLGPWHVIRVAAQRFPPAASGCATACRPAPERCSSGDSNEPDSAAMRAGSPVPAGRCPAGAACRPRRRRRRSLHRTGSAPLDRISAGHSRRTVTLIRFHALMVTAIAMTCPSSRSVKTAAACAYTSSETWPSPSSVMASVSASAARSRSVNRPPASSHAASTSSFCSLTPCLRASPRACRGRTRSG